jgi:hypothetical protein
METNQLKRQVNRLTVGMLILGAVNVILLFSAFFPAGKKQSFEEISAERINIVGKDNIPVMVISNNRLIPGPTMNGKTYPREFADGRESLSGIIFFNQYGDEVGGLVYNGFKKDAGGYSALEHLSFDQWHQNQVVALQYLDNGKTRRSGLRVYDRPTNVTLDEMFDRFKKRNETPKNTPAYDSITKEIKTAAERGDNGIERMFLGSLDEIAQLQLKDKKGNVRIKIYVDPSGDPRIEFWDANGNISKTLSN